MVFRNSNTKKNIQNDTPMRKENILTENQKNMVVSVVTLNTWIL